MTENLVIIELIKNRLNNGFEPHLYYYRDNHQNEVDVIFKNSSELIPIEIKSSQTFHAGFLKSIKFYQKLVGERSGKGYLIYNGNIEQQIDRIQVFNFKNTNKIL